MMMGSKTLCSFAKEILSSLHLSAFSWTRFSRDHSITLLAIACTWLSPPFTTTSDTVVSSTYFHCCALVSRSLIIRRNNHGPSLVPCGTPAGTGTHSEKHSDANLIRWGLSDKKSIIQLIMLAGNLHWLHNFLTSILWSIYQSTTGGLRSLMISKTMRLVNNRFN